MSESGDEVNVACFGVVAVVELMCFVEGGGDQFQKKKVSRALCFRRFFRALISMVFIDTNFFAPSISMVFIDANFLFFSKNRLRVIHPFGKQGWKKRHRRALPPLAVEGGNPKSWSRQTARRTMASFFS